MDNRISKVKRGKKGILTEILSNYAHNIIDYKDDYIGAQVYMDKEQKLIKKIFKLFNEKIDG